MKDDDHIQNIYDDPEFFDGYSQMDRFKGRWGRGMEHPAFLELLGDVAGLWVLDLGCGAGQLCYHLAEAGAAEVIGIDVSETMLGEARSRSSHPRVAYRRQAIEDADFQPGTFNVVVSSLALHYVRDYKQLVNRIAQWIIPGGRLVFSAEHPIYTARGWTDGWVIDRTGAPISWAIDHYADEGVREHHWYVPGVRRYHRTLATLLNGLIDAGLVIERLEEPVPDDGWLHDHPQDADERRRPMFLLISARKRKP